MPVFQVFSKSELDGKYTIPGTGSEFRHKPHPGKKFFEAYINGLSDFSLVIKELSEYYGKDASHERVSSFFAWIKKNQSELLAELKSDMANGNIGLGSVEKEGIRFLLGFWLGARYVVSRYPHKKSPAFPKISEPGEINRLMTLDRTADYNKSYHVFELGYKLMENKFPELAESFLAGVNVGIHECSHALGRILGKQKRGALSEFATYFNQAKFGLPIKAGHLGGRYEYSIRDILHLSDGEGNFLKSDYILEEYSAFLVGPWVNKFYGEKLNIFSFKSARTADSKELARSIYLEHQSYPFPLNYIGDALDYVFHSKFTPGEFCKVIGTDDEDLIKKFTSVFDDLRKEDYSDTKSFYKAFVRIMNAHFGKIPMEDIPDGYVSLFIPEEGKTSKSVLGSIPSKNKA